MGTLALEGSLRANGGDAVNATGGAAGSIWVTADAIVGNGRIEAEGGTSDKGGGGGGRIAVRAGDLAEWRGSISAIGGTGLQSPDLHASPGTILVHGPGSIDGTLTLDNGRTSEGDPRPASPTILPVLEAGSVSATEIVGEDAWITAEESLLWRWVGAWMELKDAAGLSLGEFRVAERSDDGRIRLEGAGGVALSAATYKGEYRFDEVELLDGAGLDSPSPIVAPDIRLSGDVKVAGAGLVTERLTIGAGSVLRPATASGLELRVTDLLTVEAGAVIDVTGAGYARSGSSAGNAPEGVVPSPIGTGGSHGGSGTPHGDDVVAGETYGSLFAPSLSGASGAPTGGVFWKAGARGGGWLRLDVGTLALEGSLRANGGDAVNATGGAAGSIWVTADAIVGNGRIEARGGTSGKGGGGGGRIALWSGGTIRDLDLTLDATGGQDLAKADVFGGPGTIFLRGADAPLGILEVRQDEADPQATPLPSIGRWIVGTVTAAEPSEDGAAWLEPLDPETTVSVGVAGMFVRIEGVDHRVLAQDGRRRLLVEGATGVAVGSDVVGGYRFDDVVVGGRAKLQVSDLLEAGSWIVGPDATVEQADLVPPVVESLSPADGAVFTALGPVPVSAEVSDDRGVARVRFFLGTESTVLTEAPWSWTTMAPDVDETTIVVLRVVAEDTSGGSTTREHLLTIEPNVSVDVPVGTISFAPGAPSSLRPGIGTTVRVHAEDLDGMESIELRATGDVTTPVQTIVVSGTSLDVDFGLTAVEGAAEGDVVVNAILTDRWGAVGESAPFTVPLVANSLPHGFVAFATGTPASVPAGSILTVVVHAEDEEGLDEILLEVVGPATPTSVTRPVSGTAADTTIDLGVSASASDGDVVTVRARISDVGGATEVWTDAVTIPVAADVVAPEVTITLSPEVAGDRYPSGEVVELVAEAFDDSGVEQIRLEIDGEVVATGTAAASSTWTVPVVTEPTTFLLTAIATDPAGNEAQAGRSVVAEPLSNLGAPTIETDCASTGAMFPSGEPISLTVTATDDLGVGSIDFYLDDETTPFASVTPASGTVSPFSATASTTLPIVEDGEVIVRVRAVARDASGNATESVNEISVVPTVDLHPDGEGENDWTALADEIGVLRAGTLTHDGTSTLAGLIVLPGATLGHSQGATAGLDLEVEGRVYLACGASLDVTGRGYAAHATYPGASIGGNGSAGSHLGIGGIWSGAGGSTYGSVTRPREHGSGGQNSAPYGQPGGGTIRLAAGQLVVDGSIRAEGGSSTATNRRAGAGGSIWIQASETVSGAGSISARGGTAPSGSVTSGGGGAVAIEYGGLSGRIATNLSSSGGGNDREGGAGTIYLLGPSSTYGDLIVDNGDVVGEATELPSLGNGLAQAGSAGAVLETDRPSIPSFFEGHWVEVRDAGGDVRGTWRIAAIEGSRLTLEPHPSSPVNVEVGDTWRGIYLFDHATVAGTVELRSLDPIRVVGTQELRGEVTLDRIDAGDLVLRAGTILTHGEAVSAAEPGLLQVTLTRDLRIEVGASIDATGRGYPANVTYSGASMGGSGSAGSHIGVGGIWSGSGGSTYGSVTRPLENGSGGQYSASYGQPGGGAVHVVARNVVVDGEIRADGGSTTSTNRRAGAGGSVWIQASGTVTGAGSISARGGTTAEGSLTSGGGGAIAIEHEGLSGLVSEQLLARGGDTDREGGAGTVYLLGPSSTYGDLVVDNGDIVGEATELPALGSGVAQTGTSGEVLMTDRSSIPSYFAGHWVEIRDPSGELRGTWRIAAIDGTQLTLEPNGGSPAEIFEDDRWQGVYLFDRTTVVGAVELRSADPLRVAGTQELRGEIRLERIEAGDLVLRSGAVLQHPAAVDAATPGLLEIELTRDLVVEAGASIDASGLGYPANVTYPGASMGGNGSAGSHIGVGGIWSGSGGSTYGSVTRPLENGSGGQYSASYGQPGGGAVHVVARNVVVDGEIRADGGSTTSTNRRAGAGGSVWIQASGTVTGAGSISARGGTTAEGSLTSGGGGAIAIEHEGLSGVVSEQLLARGGGTDREGGAGTVYLFGPSSTYGDLIVDNGDIAGEATELPALGSGVAQTGTGGAVLMTDRSSIPAYFAGHWVEIRDPADAVRGVWRIEGIVDGIVTLEDDAAISPGDSWQGVYRFDSVTVTDGGAFLQSLDPIDATIPSSSVAVQLDERAVLWEAGLLPGTWSVSAGPGAVDAPARFELRGVGRAGVVPRSADGTSRGLWVGAEAPTFVAFPIAGKVRFGDSAAGPVTERAERRFTLPEGEEMRHVVPLPDGGMALGDRTVRLFSGDGERWVEVVRDGEPLVVQLVVGSGWLGIVRADGVELIGLEPLGESSLGISAPAGLSIVAAHDVGREVILLLRSDAIEPELAFARLDLEAAGAELAPIMPHSGLPGDHVSHRVLVAAGFVVLESSGHPELPSVVWTFGSDDLATPLSAFVLTESERLLGGGERGLILASGHGAELLVPRGDGRWKRSDHFPSKVAADAAVLFGDRHLVRFADGRLVVLDLGEQGGWSPVFVSKGWARERLEGAGDRLVTWQADADVDPVVIDRATIQQPFESSADMQP